MDNYNMPSLIAIITTLTIILFALYIIALKLRQFFWTINTRQKNQENNIRKSIELIEQLTSNFETRATETQNAIYLSQLNFHLPIFMGGWSIDTFLGKFLVQHIVNTKPKTILELGSGASTLIIEKTLQLINSENYCHMAVDHEQKYLEITRENARQNKLDKQVTWLECPLIHYDEYEKLWYGGLAEKLRNKKIDLLVIDGPPGDIQSHSRFPAIPILRPFLNDNCVIVLDDAARKEEQEIARMWVKDNPELTLRFELEGHGLAILTLTPQKS